MRGPEGNPPTSGVGGAGASATRRMGYPRPSSLNNLAPRAKEAP